MGLCSLLVSCLAWSNPVQESISSTVGLLAISKKDLGQHMTPRTAAGCAPVSTAGHCQPMPPQKTLKHPRAGLAQSLMESLLLSPGSWCIPDFVCSLQESLFPPVLREFCNQIPHIISSQQILPLSFSELKKKTNIKNLQRTWIWIGTKGFRLDSRNRIQRKTKTCAHINFKIICETLIKQYWEELWKKKGNLVQSQG